MKKLMLFLPVCFVMICNFSCSKDENPLEQEKEYPYLEIVSMDENFISSCEVSFIGEDSVNIVIARNSDVEFLHVEAQILDTSEEQGFFWFSNIILPTIYFEFENDEIEFGYKHDYYASEVKFIFTKWGDGYDITNVLEVITIFKKPYWFNPPFYF